MGFMKVLTIKDIAALSGVGISTVSRVLNGRPDVSEETKRKVLCVVETHNYTQNSNAKNLKQRHTNLVSIVVRGRHNNFLSDIAERIINIGNLNKQMFLLHYIDEHADEFEAARQLFAERKVKGMIFVGSNTVGREAEISALGLPCVFTTVDTGALGVPSVSSVSVDNVRGGRMAVDHLIEYGHTRIAVFGGGRAQKDSIGLRYSGVLESFEAHGLNFDQSLYVPCSFVMEKAYRTAKRFLSKKHAPFTAVFAMSDAMAIGIIKALYEENLRVPDDISVVGFDGIPLSQYILPPLTTVVQPAEAMARCSVDLILRLLDDPADAQNITLKSKLLLGGTVKKLEHPDRPARARHPEDSAAADVFAFAGDPVVDPVNADAP